VLVDGDNPPVVNLYGPVSSQSSLWRVASVSKVFTAIAVMQLAERGKLLLDEDVYILAATLLAYIPFVSYWNLKL
jgi:CubicO group peptidase (beta-lactamase class C family)